jgi:hypothetical protein
MEPPPQRTKRARRKSSRGAAGDSGRDEEQVFERWNLRHSERSERGGKVPEGLRVIQVGMRSRSLSDGTSATANEESEEEKFRRGCG